MEMRYPDGIGRDNWDRVGSPSRTTESRKLSWSKAGLTTSVETAHLQRSLPVVRCDETCQGVDEVLVLQVGQQLQPRHHVLA